MRKTIIMSVVLAMAACTGDSSTTTTSPTLPSTSEGGSPTTEAPPPTIPPGASTTEILELLGGVPCPDSEFTCVTLELPLNHFDPDDDRTIDVVFGVLPASGESRGAFFTATGGPGSSGLDSADGYTELYAEEIVEQYDIVFFDQRGIASSGGFDCPDAALEYYRADGDVVTAAGINQFIEAARVFAEDCISEMGDPEELGYTSTAQVAEDIQAFIEVFGFDEFVLFGESYGTQLGQVFAAAHPESIDRLIIDGVVDLTLEANAYALDAAVASSRTLDLMLEACQEDKSCTDDMGRAAEEAYDLLQTELLEGPMDVEFPLPDGGFVTREFTLSDLEIVAAGHLYEEYDRMMFLRALAAYSGRGDLVPLQRLVYVNLVQDPTTLEVIVDPGWSDAMYYGVDCLDYSFPGATPEEKVENYMSAASGLDALRLGSVFFGELPCVFWPHTSDEPRPPALTAEGIQVLVLGSTVDPVTPYHQGLDVYSRLDDGYQMSKEGGPHVIFGWGEACPDEEVTAFIVDGTPPTTEICDGVVVGDYQPLFPLREIKNPVRFFDTLEWEIYYFPEYYYWDGVTDISTGCGNGGTMAFTATDTGNDFSLEDCELVPGTTLDGTGAYDSDNDVFTLEVTIEDCMFTYERAEDEYSVDSACPLD